MKAIYQMKFECGRQGCLTGIFTAKVDAMRVLIDSGREVYFGEVLGKHSEVCGPVTQAEIKLISDDCGHVDLFEALGMATGYNPFDYIDGGEDAVIEDGANHDQP